MSNSTEMRKLMERLNYNKPQIKAPVKETVQDLLNDVTEDYDSGEVGMLSPEDDGRVHGGDGQCPECGDDSYDEHSGCNRCGHKSMAETINDMRSEFDAHMQPDVTEDLSNSSSYPWDEMHVLHFSDEKSDKIWGYFSDDNYVYAFWGRRNGTYQFKRMPGTMEASMLMNKKINKGYVDISDHSMARDIAIDAYTQKDVYSEAVNDMRMNEYSE